MSYTPNNPYIPGDPYSYDLKWIVRKLKEAITLYQPLNDQFTDLYDYVHDYFDNLDLSEEVREAIGKLQSTGYFNTLIYEIAITDGNLQAYVTDWLADNVTPVGSAVLVDDSLTTAGAAADAQKAGNLFDWIKGVGASEIYGFRQGNNIAINSSTVLQGKYAFDNGSTYTIVNNPNYRVWVIKNPPKTICYYTNSPYVVVLDKHGNFVTGTGNSGTHTSSIDLTNYTDAYYILISWVNTVNTPRFTTNSNLALFDNTYYIDGLKVTYSDTVAKEQAIAYPAFKYPYNKALKLYYDRISLDDYDVMRMTFPFTVNSKGDGWAEVTSPSIANYNSTFYVYDKFNYNIIAQKTAGISFAATSFNNLSMLYIGDSTVAGGQIVKKIVDNYAAQGATVTTMGTTSALGNSFEGHSGWTAAQYANSATIAGVTNPFYNNGFDFGYYLSSNGYNAPDIVVLQMGLNDFTGYMDPSTNAARVSAFLTNMQTMIDSIRSAAPNAKIIVNSIFGPNSKPSAYPTAQYIPELARFNILNANAGIESLTDCAIAPLHMVVNPDTMINDDVHPNAAGYAFIGDFMTDIISVL